MQKKKSMPLFKSIRFPLQEKNYVCDNDILNNSFFNTNYKSIEDIKDSSLDNQENIASASEKNNERIKPLIKSDLKAFIPTDRLLNIKKRLATQIEDLSKNANHSIGNKNKQSWLLNALSFIDVDQSIPEEDKTPVKIMKRASELYSESPKTFTERLLTILEESVNGEDSEISASGSGVNLSRLTSELKRMWKCIEDESMPEMAPSLCGDSMMTSFCSPVNNRRYSMSKPKTIYRKTPLNIFKRRMSLNETSNNTFEYWESHCKNLFPNENKGSPCLHKSASSPDIANMENIRKTSDMQMALLNSDIDILSSTDNNKLPYNAMNSPICTNNKSKCTSSPLLEQELEGKLKKCKIQLFTDPIIKKSILTTACSTPSNNDLPYEKKSSITNSYISDKADQYEQTFLHALAEKRQRCLDTAKLMLEINSESCTPIIKKLMTNSPEYSSRKESDSNKQFIKTLVSCGEYRNFLLETRKSYISTPQIQKEINEAIDTAAKKRSSTRKKPNESKKFVGGTLTATRCTSNRLTPGSNCRLKGIVGNSELKVSPAKPRARLFVTPDKNKPQPTYRNRPTTYFKDINTEKKKLFDDKCPYNRGIFRINYDNVKSPVAMYIQGKQKITPSPGGR
ncbi:uncharacterized protein [Prorops nasuta]